MKSYLKAIFVGGLIYLVVSNLLDLPIVMSAINATKGDNSQYAVINYIKAHYILRLSEIFINVFSSMLAGYVAALITNNKKPLAGILSSVLITGINIFHLVSGFYTAFEFDTVLNMLMPPVFGFIGGYIKEKNK